MKLRTFNVPFSEIVEAESTEIEFDPASDYLVIKSFYAEPTNEVREFVNQLEAVTDDTPQETADALVLDLLKRCVVEWHLLGVDGKEIPKPSKIAELNALPGVVRGALFNYLASFRGKPDPTPAA